MINSFKVNGTNKELFLQNLDKLFNDFGGRFTCANTIVVDNSPAKHIMNKPKTVVFYESWSYNGDGARDTFLLDVLFPQSLHQSPNQGLLSF